MKTYHFDIRVDAPDDVKPEKVRRLLDRLIRNGLEEAQASVEDLPEADQNSDALLALDLEIKPPRLRHD